MFVCLFVFGGGDYAALQSSPREPSIARVSTAASSGHNARWRRVNLGFLLRAHRSKQVKEGEMT